MKKKRNIKLRKEKPVKFISTQLKDFIDSGLVKLITIPPIESINYGRTVGYDIIEHIPPKAIHNISATKIRNKQK